MISWLKENNVAVITGGANGIGRSAVDAFLGHGLHVVAIDRDDQALGCLLYTSPSPRDATLSRMPSSA